MEQSQLEKIKLAFFQMNDDYWDRLTARSSNLSDCLKEITTSISDNFLKLAIIQLDILNTKYKGYEHLLLSGKTDFTGFITENKKSIAKSTEKKTQIASNLSDLLSELNSIIEEMRTLGE